MDINKRVRLKSDFILEKIDNEITVFHPSLATAIYLNESGALIWELCDGNRRIMDIVEILQETYPENTTQIKKDVLAIIYQLEAQNVADLID